MNKICSKKWEVSNQFYGQHKFTFLFANQDVTQQLSPISILERCNRISVVVMQNSLSVVPHQKLLSNFEDLTRWNNLGHGFNSARLDPIIVLDKFYIPGDHWNEIASGISQETASFVINESFCREYPIGSSGTSDVIIIASLVECKQNLCLMESNWFTGPQES